LFTVDSTTLEEISKRYQSLQPKSLTSQFTERLAKKRAVEKYLKLFIFKIIHMVKGWF
jgi:uncharacterized SAM-dependent methyltransferase